MVWREHERRGSASTAASIACVLGDRAGQVGLERRRVDAGPGPAPSRTGVRNRARPSEDLVGRELGDADRAAEQRQDHDDPGEARRHQQDRRRHRRGRSGRSAAAATARTGRRPGRPGRPGRWSPTRPASCPTTSSRRRQRQQRDERDVARADACEGALGAMCGRDGGSAGGDGGSPGGDGGSAGGEGAPDSRAAPHCAPLRRGRSTARIAPGTAARSGTRKPSATPGIAGRAAMDRCGTSPSAPVASIAARPSRGRPVRARRASSSRTATGRRRGCECPPSRAAAGTCSRRFSTRRPGARCAGRAARPGSGA